MQKFPDSRGPGYCAGDHIAFSEGGLVHAGSSGFVSHGGFRSISRPTNGNPICQNRRHPVAIATFIGERRLEWGPMSALGTLMLVLPALFALIGQRYIVQGLTFGAVKE